MALGTEGVLDEDRLRSLGTRPCASSKGPASNGHDVCLPWFRDLFRGEIKDDAQQGGPDQHTLQCMEIWGGIEPVERTVATPGLDLWVFSQPFGGDEQGGDVYYVTLCGGGLITRIVVADVSGHGSSVAEFSSVVTVVVA